MKAAPSNSRVFNLAVRWLDERTRTLPFALGVGLIVFAGLALISETLFLFHSRQLESEARVAALSHASALRARMDRELNAVLYLSNGLAAYISVRRDHLNPKEINTLLAELHRNSRHVRNFAIAVAYRLTYVYPKKGNENVVGNDYRELAAQWPQVKRTVASGKATLLGPVDLVQGGSGLIYRVPVIVNGKYWGLISTVIDTDSLFRSAFGAAGSEHHELAVRGKDGQGQAGEMIWGNPGLINGVGATHVEADIPNGKWVLAVLPKSEPASMTAIGPLRLLSWLLAILLGIAAATVLRHRVALSKLATYDSLTMLPNRRLLDDRLEQLIYRSLRDEHIHCGIIFIDLSDFKNINDRFGHKAGDLALIVVAQRIREDIRQSDTVARWGGDEFVVLIGDTDKTQIAQLAERLRHSIERPIEKDNLVLHVGASIGYALHPEDGIHPESLIRTADQRMYQDKQRGKP